MPISLFPQSSAVKRKREIVFKTCEKEYFPINSKFYIQQFIINQRKLSVSRSIDSRPNTVYEVKDEANI